MADTNDKSTLDVALGNGGELLDGLAKLWSVSQGNAYNGSVNVTNTTAQPVAVADNNMWLYIGGAVAVVLLLVLLMSAKK